MIIKFVPNVRAAWADANAGKGGKGKQAAKKEEAPKADDDDVDLFGDDDGDDEEAAKLAEKKKAEAEAKKAKKVVIAKSLVLFEVKPWGEETDLDAMAADILKIEQDGLVWKTEYKKEPIAYGVNKLIIGCVIEDAKVSTDDLQQKIEELEDYVQSCDIAAFNKI